ncbi:YqaE/Pmp3 family membrane protein [Verrucomicrobiaceae bacterium 227]
MIIAFFLPPLAVALHAGIGKKFIINVILTLLFWLPGFIHALMVIA